MNYNTLLEDLAYYEGEVARIEALTDEEYAAEAGCDVMCHYPWGEGKSEREVTLFDLRQDLSYTQGLLDEMQDEQEEEDYYMDPAFSNSIALINYLY
jgi:hypothetical protein